MSSNENKLGYVDAMRGIAILMVILVHTSQRVPNLSPLMGRLAEYSQMGVQLFFVVSAYTLCLSFERRSKEPYSISSFYIRRLFRIAPLYYIAIPIYFAFHIVKQHYNSEPISTTEPYSIVNIVANILFIHGFVPSANNNIVPGGWSIGTEMAFYLCFPLLFVISKKIAGNRPIQLFALLLFCLGANLALQLIIIRVTNNSFQNGNFFYFNIINQLPVFLVGIIAYSLHSQKIHPIILSRLVSIFGFLIFFAIPLLLWKSKMQLLFAVIPTISAISYLFLMNWIKATKRQSGLLCKIGVVSFSMYIFHFLFAWGLVPTIIGGISGIVNPDIMLLLAFLLTCALTFCVALITQQSIEAKGISTGAKIISHLQERAKRLL
jgi:peptidoglycan/LPS O-acetylase OafA/YrhL